MPAVSFVSLLPLGDTTIRHELLGLFLLFEDLKGIRSKPDGSTPQIANSEHSYVPPAYLRIVFGVFFCELYP